MNKVLLHIMQRRCTDLSWLRRSQHTGGRYHHNNIAKIIMPIMHSTAGHGDWFTPTMWHACCTCVGLHSYNIQTTLEFARKLTETISSRTSQYSCFDPHLIAVFTPAQNNHTNRATAPESILTGPNSSGLIIPLVFQNQSACF